MRARMLLGLAVAMPLATTMLPAQVTGQRVLHFDTMTVAFPTISPDGRWIVFQHRINNQDTRLMIQPLSAGAPRILLDRPGQHAQPRFTPQGDRLFFISSLPRRGPTDDRSYLVAASFDTRSGTLTSEPRQISLEGVRFQLRWMPTLSPDGLWVAYVDCCGAPALKVIPSGGGNARILDQGTLRMPPSWIGWSSDSRYVTYELRDSSGATRFRVSRDGGKPRPMGRMIGPGGTPSPDGKYFAIIEGGARRVLRLSSADGTPIVTIPATRFAPPSLSFSADGKYLIGASDNTTAPIKMVPVAGGSMRQVGSGASYEWPVGWSRDSREVHLVTVENEKEVLMVVSADGAVKQRVAMPEGAGVLGIQEGTVVFRERMAGRAVEYRLMAMHLADGSIRELARNVQTQLCCEPVMAGGVFFGTAAEEIPIRQLRGDRLQIRALRLNGSSRLLADLPSRFLGRTGYAIYANRVVYVDAAKDSIKVQMLLKPDGVPKTIATLPSTASPGEYVWSPDGRHLALYTNGQPWTLMLFRFDSAGTLQGAPRTLPAPFEYGFQIAWLPDGSGLTLIAQPRGSTVTEVALIRLNDPEHPVLLTKDDPVSKWGYALSPDGKFVSFPSEQQGGSSIHLIEVAPLLKNARR